LHGRFIFELTSSKDLEGPEEEEVVEDEDTGTGKSCD
jgi:hypothetical protein